MLYFNICFIYTALLTTQQVKTTDITGKLIRHNVYVLYIREIISSMFRWYVVIAEYRWLHLFYCFVMSIDYIYI